MWPAPEHAYAFESSKSKLQGSKGEGRQARARQVCGAFELMLIILADEPLAYLRRRTRLILDCFFGRKCMKKMICTMT